MSARNEMRHKQLFILLYWWLREEANNYNISICSDMFVFRREKKRSRLLLIKCHIDIIWIVISKKSMQKCD